MQTLIAYIQLLLKWLYMVLLYLMKFNYYIFNNSILRFKTAIFHPKTDKMDVGRVNLSREIVVLSDSILLVLLQWMQNIIVNLKALNFSFIFRYLWYVSDTRAVVEATAFECNRLTSLFWFEIARLDLLQYNTQHV